MSPGSGPDAGSCCPSAFVDRALCQIGRVRHGGQGTRAPRRIDPALAFVRLLEELVDRVADLLEGSRRDLDDASHVIFRPDRERLRLSHESALLRRLMIRTGRTSERMARIHYTLVCLDRMAKFTIDRGARLDRAEMASRLQIGLLGHRFAGPVRRKAWSTACSFCRTPRAASSTSTRTT